MGEYRVWMCDAGGTEQVNMDNRGCMMVIGNRYIIGSIISYLIVTVKENLIGAGNRYLIGTGSSYVIVAGNSWCR